MAGREDVLAARVVGARPGSILLVLALNLFGDALSDELDPRYRSNA